jgi:putative beta-lysine N-acetyltransferase
LSYSSAVTNKFPYEDWGFTKNLHLDTVQATIDVSLYNQRLSILSYDLLSSRGIDDLSHLLDIMAVEYNLSKIWGKIPRREIDLFLDQGFTAEAWIGQYFINDDAVVCSKFFQNRDISRSIPINKKILQEVAAIPTADCSSLPRGYYFKIAQPSDLTAVSSLFKQVFTTYPYPVFDDNYLRSSLNHVIYGLVYSDKNRLAAVASAETNPHYKNAEMTDFATLPEERGKGLASVILQELELILKNQNYHSVYTIARSTSHGMNTVFQRADYNYSGTLINNCNIAGGFEDMNVWCKLL